MIIGIDPGATGAIAFNIGGYVEVYDLPIVRTPLKRRTKKGKKKTEGRLDYEKFRELIHQFSVSSADIVVFEKVHSMPGNSPSTSFTFGRIVGQLEGVLSGSTEITYVTPQAWKKYHGLLKQPKEASVELARQKYPGMKWLKTKDGRSDAVLIAEYGRYLFNLTKERP